MLFQQHCINFVQGRCQGCALVLTSVCDILWLDMHTWGWEWVQFDDLGYLHMIFSHWLNWAVVSSVQWSSSLTGKDVPIKWGVSSWFFGSSSGSFSQVKVMCGICQFGAVTAVIDIMSYPGDKDSMQPQCSLFVAQPLCILWKVTKYAISNTRCWRCFLYKMIKIQVHFCYLNTVVTCPPWKCYWSL